MESEPRPGTAFKTIDQEQAMLDEFMAMMEKKYFRNSALLGVFTDIPSGWRLMNGSKRMGLFQPGERLKCPVTRQSGRFDRPTE
jgi:hypothetical protein